jgi:succinoglycan biosynthesis transport protein ExoP
MANDLSLAPFTPALPRRRARALMWGGRALLGCAILVPAGTVVWTLEQPLTYRTHVVIDYGRDPASAQLSPSAGDSPYEWRRTQDVLLTSGAVLGSALDSLEPNASPGAVASREAEAVRGRAVEELRQRVRVSEVSETTLCRISYEDPDPKRAARMANAIVQAYLERARELRAMAAQQTYAWFSEQIEASRRQLTATENELETYSAQHPMPPIPLEERQRMLVQEIETLSGHLTEARVSRIQHAARLTKLNAAIAAESPFDAHSTEVDANEQVKQLRSAYIELRVREHELGTSQESNSQAAIIVATKLIALRAEMRAVLDGIRASARSELVAAQQVEEQLGLALQRANSESKQLQGLQLEYGRLRRERSGAEALLKALHDRASASAVAAANEATGPKLIETALVPHEALPRPWARNLVVAAMVSLAGILVAGRLRSCCEALP